MGRKVEGVGRGGGGEERKELVKGRESKVVVRGGVKEWSWLLGRPRLLGSWRCKGMELVAGKAKVVEVAEVVLGGVKEWSWSLGRPRLLRSWRWSLAVGCKRGAVLKAGLRPEKGVAVVRLARLLGCPSWSEAAFLPGVRLQGVLMHL